MSDLEGMRITPALLDVLEVLVKAPDPIHAYEIGRRAGRVSASDKGNVYRMMRRLVEAEVVAVDEAMVGDELRRVYMLREERRGYVEKLLERKRP